MHTEELSEQGTGGSRHMTRAIFDLGEVGLTDRSTGLLADRLDDFQLGHRPAEAAQRPFDVAQIAELLGQGHRKQQYVYFILRYASSRRAEWKWGNWPNPVLPGL